MLLVSRLTSFSSRPWSCRNSREETGRDWICSLQQRPATKTHCWKSHIASATCCEALNECIFKSWFNCFFFAPSSQSMGHRGPLSSSNDWRQEPSAFPNTWCLCLMDLEEFIWWLPRKPMHTIHTKLDAATYGNVLVYRISFWYMLYFLRHWLSIGVDWIQHAGSRASNGLVWVIAGSAKNTERPQAFTCTILHHPAPVDIVLVSNFGQSRYVSLVSSTCLKASTLLGCLGSPGVDNGDICQSFASWQIMTDWPTSATYSDLFEIVEECARPISVMAENRQSNQNGNNGFYILTYAGAPGGMPWVKLMVHGVSSIAKNIPYRRGGISLRCFQRITVLAFGTEVQTWPWDVLRCLKSSDNLCDIVWHIWPVQIDSNWSFDSMWSMGWCSHRAAWQGSPCRVWPQPTVAWCRAEKCCLCSVLQTEHVETVQLARLARLAQLARATFFRSILWASCGRN